MPRKYIRLSVDKDLDDELKKLIKEDHKIIPYRNHIYEQALKTRLKTLKSINDGIKKLED